MIARIPFRTAWLVACVLLLAAVAAAPSRAAEPAPAELRLKVGTFDPREAAAGLPPSLRYLEEPDAGYFVIQLDRPIDAALLESLRARGAWPVQYLPERSYLLRLPAGRKSALRAMPGVRWLGAVQPGWKLSPGLGKEPRPATLELYVTVDLFGEESTAVAAAQIAALGAEVVETAEYSDTRRLWVRATPLQLEQTARLQAVSWIEEVGEIRFRNDHQRWVVQTDNAGSTRVWDLGLRGEGQVIGHIDGPLDIDSCYFRDPVDNTPGVGHRKVIGFRMYTGLPDHAHGTHTAGSAAGDSSPITGSLSNAGNAAKAKISHTDIFGLEEPSNLYSFLNDARLDGAQVHTNSWGLDDTDYTAVTRDVDLFSYDYEDSLVVFAVAGGFVKSPENAKSVLAVGATDNSLNSFDHCSGGNGPTVDGRSKPDMLGPGCNVLSTLADSGGGQSCDVAINSGTSMATPAVAGAGVLVRQYFEEGWHPSGTKTPADAFTPSGALVKAMLTNSGVDVTGTPEYPSDLEGWGRVLLDNVLYFDGDLRELAVPADVRNVNGLTTGQSDSYMIDVTNDLEDLKVTLVFTEPAAALMAASATVNNLDLEVLSPSMTLYKGNWFDEEEGTSLPNGSADGVNTVEMVLLETPELGQWTITVKGTSVTQGTQGYALVATGQLTAATGGSLRYSSHTVQDTGALANNDGAADPGETITLPLSLINLRQTGITSVSADLGSLSAGQAHVTGGTASYPNLGSNATGGSLSPHYTVTIPPDVPCGSVIPFRVDASHAGGSTQSSFPLTIGHNDVVRASTDVPKSIPNITSGVESTLVVNDTFSIGNVYVNVNISHHDVFDLTVTLESPQGTQVQLRVPDSGQAQLNLDTKFDLEEPVQDPAESMSSFDNESALGTWKLSIEDDVFLPIQTGTLNSWSLELAPATGALCTPLTCAGDPVPAEVGPTFMVDVSGSDLQFNWPSVSGATKYRVWRSEGPTFEPEQLLGTTTGTSLSESGSATVAETWYYLVRAVNSCEWEGP